MNNSSTPAYPPYERIATLKDIPFDAHCVVVCDAALPAHILDQIPDPLLVQAGESLKTFTEVAMLAEAVLRRRSSRPMTLVAVGGGSVGDTVGFLASILWRGVDLWHVPTTLLSMVDSSHGGKTALNLNSHKNQIGTFHPAARVFLVDELLATLPPALRGEGLAELVKSLMIAAPDALLWLASPGRMDALLTAPFEDICDDFIPLIKEAIRVKLDIVKSDPFERLGERTKLNFGHTLGHALELTAHLSHGAAVAWGLMAAINMSRHAGLDDASIATLRRIVYPLLKPLPNVPSEKDLMKAMTRDKKRRGRQLHSVLLEAPGQAVVTNELSALDWVEAMYDCIDYIADTPVRVHLKNARPIDIHPAAGKSELNRALIMAALRTGPTVIRGRSHADDVERMVVCLRTLGVSITETADGWEVAPRDEASVDPRASLELDCGLGGTTFRFMLALAALRPGRTRLRIGRQLAARPHDALVNALNDAGARIETTEDGYEVHGWNKVPNSFKIDVSVSSQFASALAMLSLVCDGPFTLRLEGKAVSSGYLDMTVSMLKQAGMECIQSDEVLAFNPTQSVGDPLDLAIPADAGIEAVWKTAARLGVPVELASTGVSVRHPDHVVDDMLAAILKEDGRNEIELDCTHCPDLVPILTTAALRSNRSVQFTGIAHLQYKESDRLHGLATSLRSAGIQVDSGPGWIRIPRQKPGPTKEVRRFETHDDHRMVFAGLLLSVLLGPLVISSPWSVTKSYPDFWADARMAGWIITPDV